MLCSKPLLNPAPTRAGATDSFVRYAIGYAPRADSPLGQFGRAWFDNETGTGQSRLARLAAAPNRDRLYANLLPPFALRAGMVPGALKTRLQSFAGRRKPLQTGPLALLAFRGALGLAPSARTPSLDWVAAQCFAAFDCFRAPADEIDRNRWRQEPLTDHQRLLLEIWGSPFVLGEYRFHMLLTEPLDTPRQKKVAQAIWPLLEEVCIQGIEIEALTLFGDPGHGRPLKLLHRYPLDG
jgi:hypothetical protein